MAMVSAPILYLALGVTAAMAALADIAAGTVLTHGYLRLVLRAFIAGGAIALSALTWEVRR